MFIYKNWDKFCNRLNEIDLHSITANDEFINKNRNFLILKHDVETNPKKAYKLAQIESKHGHKGTYYVQAYLLNSRKNIKYLKNIQNLGHEVSYHHDVMDSNGGNIQAAIAEFKTNLNTFKNNGFEVFTVCQHGNPIVERKGYYSNRDFFRNDIVRQEFSHITEIMVDYKQTIDVCYKYVSDAGYGWKCIYDPETNDIVNSDDKNISIDNFDELLKFIKTNDAIIVSTHPHRWYKYQFVSSVKTSIFKIVKSIAKALTKIEFFNKLMQKFYFLAKKI